MKRCLIASAAILTLTTSVSAVDIPDGFTALFDGKTLEGWHGRPHYDPRKLAGMSEDERQKTIDGWWEDTTAHWTVDENEELVNDGQGPYLTSSQEFADFELRLDYKTVARADSGIYLRGNPQVQIWDFTRKGGKWNRAADKGSGGLFNNYKRSPGQEPLTLADKPFGEWNAFRIRQVGARTDVWLNGKLVVDHAVMENYWDRTRPQFRTGPIQLQTHGGEIRWRNVVIREISPPEANSILAEPSVSTTASIFNGSDFAGWQGDLDSYEIVDGAIQCKAGQGGNLFTKDEYADFEVGLEFRLPPGGNNGLAIRFPGEGRPYRDGMCELQVLDSEHEKYASLHPSQYHGSVYGLVPASRGFLRETGEWNYQRVHVQGSRISVELNGFPILNADLSKVTKSKDGELPPGINRSSGFFGFAGHNDPVAFRNIRIRHIDPSEELARTTWPQFRGQNSSGLAQTLDPLPTKIGPETGVVWKTELSPGHSSPVVSGDRIYLTAVRNEKLVTIAMDRATGEVVWEKVAPTKELEKIHRIGSYAQCTPVTDGNLVIVLFGSAGLYCYDRDGNEKWTVPMGPFNNDFGAGNSPILVDGKVIIVQDHDTDSFLLALDKDTGEELWKTERAEFPRNYCSPVVWEFDGRKHIVVAATLRVVGYDVDSGEEAWTVRGLSRAVCMTPVVGEDNVLYVAGWARGGDVDERIVIPAWSDATASWDRNENGALEEDELEKGGDIQRRFGQFDRDKTGSITQAEYTWYRSVFEVAENKVLAIRPGGHGDLTDTNVAWQFRRYLPFCSSPLHVHGYVFTVKDGGIVTSLNAQTGEPIQTGRAAGTGNYYASAVAGDNKIYIADQRGHVSVLSSFAEWKTLHDEDFGEDIYATPAIVEGRIYLRTNGHLYCFD